MPDAVFGALALVIAAAVSVVMWRLFPIARDHRDECAEVPLPGSLGSSAWVELDEWKAHCDGALALFADRQQFDLDMWARQMRENA